MLRSIVRSSGRSDGLKFGRSTRALLLAILILASFAVSARAEPCQTGEIQWTVVFHGTVTDAFGPVSGATVFGQTNAGNTSTTTNAAGNYTLLVWNYCPAHITVTHALHVTPATYHSTNPTVDSAGAVNFNMKFRLVTSASPAAFNTLSLGGSATRITFSSDTTAPANVTVPLQPPMGQPFQLVRDVTAQVPAGWIRWKGTWDVPTSTTEGNYAFSSCVLPSSSATTCGGANLISELASSQISYDVTGPVVQAFQPASFSDVTLANTISASWTDATSGVDPTTLTLLIDGNTLVTSTSGSTIMGSGATLQPGVHLLQSSARDRAGNTQTKSSIFAITSITATAATATLQSSTVPVNSSGAAPGPSTVRITAPLVSVAGFNETVNASVRVGYSTVSRSFALPTTAVRFQKLNGSVIDVSVTIPTSEATHQLGIVSPSAAATSAWIPPAEMHLADVVVAVPQGYEIQGTTATLGEATASLGASSTSTPAFAVDFPSRLPISGEIQACLGQTVRCVSGSWAAVHIVPGMDAPPVPIALQGVVEDPHGEERTGASCSMGCPQAESNNSSRSGGALFGCTVYPIAATPINLCNGGTTATSADGAAAVWLNAFVYQYSELGTLKDFVFQQNSARPSQDICPNGTGGSIDDRIRGSVFRLAANQTPLDFSASPIAGGVWRANGTSNTSTSQVVKLGAVTQFEENGQPQNAGPFQLDSSSSLGLVVNTLASNLGTYWVRTDQTVDAFGLGRGAADAGSTVNAWQLDPSGKIAGGAGTTQAVQLITGTNYASHGASLEQLIRLSFQVVLDYGECLS